MLKQSQTFQMIKVSNDAKIRNRYNQVPYLTQDTNGKVTNSQLDTTNESREVSPFPACDHKAHINRHAQRHSKRKTEKNTYKIHKRSTALERSVEYFTGPFFIDCIPFWKAQNHCPLSVKSMTPNFVVVVTVLMQMCCHIGSGYFCWRN